ncbi:MAG: CoA transferase [Pseudomonadota bacterium]|nr:CoA transferase [Pseudomonadota bacterium]
MSRLNSFLAGVKVLDLSQYIPGPLASLLLADMGAEVLKIEPPSGDEMQNLGPRDDQDGPVFYRALNAGKTTRRMNLKDPDARDEFLTLVHEADVLIESFRPGVMARLGLDYATLSALNPGLIYCSMSGYGATGSLARTAGHDANYLALAGVLDRNGDDRPVFFDPPLADVSGSLFAAIAILGALIGRRATGRGCEIDLALADVVMPLQLLQVADFGANGSVPERRGTYLNGGAAYYQVYRTSDHRFVVLGGVEPKFWRAFCEAAERPDWIERQSEPLPQTELIGELSSFFEKLSLAQCVERFSAADCCFSPVLNLGEALRSPRIMERGLVQTGPSSDLQALFPALIDGVPSRPREDLRMADDRTPSGAPARPDDPPTDLRSSRPSSAR